MNCQCCHATLAAEAELCDDCQLVLDALGRLTPAMRNHVLASVLVRSARDRAQRMGCSPTACGSALGNAARTTGKTRGTLQAIARWALKAGVYERPEGFEDVRLTVPEVTSGEVTTRRQTPEEKVSTIRKKRRAGADVESLAKAHGVTPQTIETVCEGIEPWQSERVSVPLVGGIPGATPKPIDEDPACYGGPDETSECETCELSGPCADEAAHRDTEEEEPVPEPECREEDEGGVEAHEDWFEPHVTRITIRNDYCPTDAALEALKRLACPTYDQQAARDLVTVAYELGMARGGLGAYEN